jgi:hypothetical protein
VGAVHQLILDQGIETARALTSDKIERQCIQTAFAILSDEDRSIGITHAGFAMAALPHKAIKDAYWVRQGPNIRLLVESGRDKSGELIGLPYGAVARMILLYLQTEAVRTKSREIALGRSMNHWLRNMGIEVGGKSYQMVREQSRRLSFCRLTFFREADDATLITNGSFVRDAILPAHNKNDASQFQLWRESIKLDEGFYKSLVEHPLPVREAAIREIAHRSMAIDIYIWLAYRLHKLHRITPISWNALHEQFGAGFNLVRQFKAKVKVPLALALAAYPEATVEIDNYGVKLHPSPAPIPERQTTGALNLIKRQHG